VAAALVGPWPWQAVSQQSSQWLEPHLQLAALVGTGETAPDKSLPLRAELR
jgi:hypothetical protein